MNATSDPSRRPSTRTRQQSSSASHLPQQQDQYYGHEDVAKLCAAYVAFTFSCPEIPPTSSTSAVNPAQPPPPPPPPLANFIAYALHRTRLHSCVTFTALFLLARLKTRFPAARGSSGHRLFISAFMIASKVVCDDTYSNKSWCVVGQGMFSLKEINQMEREMCSYLEWKLNFEPAELASFESKVRREFATTRSGAGVSVPRIDTSVSNVASSSAPAAVVRKTSYPSPPDSPTSPPTANPPASHRTQQMTPPDSSRASSHAASSTFSSASAASSVTSLASSTAPKAEPGYAYVSRSVW